MSANTIEITDSNFDAEVAKSTVPVLIDFWATWCKPCKQEMPGYQKLVDLYGSRGFAVVGLKFNDMPDTEDPILFAKKLGVKVEFVPTTSRTRIPLLQNGSIDCEFGITTPTVERENTVDFSIPYVWDAVSIIIKEGASKSVKDYAPPKKVATTQGSYIIELFKQHIANPEIVLFQEYPDAVQALRNGKVDGVGVNRASSVAYVRKGSGLEMSENMVRDPWGIMVRPNDSNWRNWLNHTLQELWKDGTYKTLWEKHMGEAPDFYMFSPYMLQPGIK
jgi:polar amino acid transport system substrate-binding protein